MINVVQMEIFNAVFLISPKKIKTDIEAIAYLGTEEKVPVNVGISRFINENISIPDLGEKNVFLSRYIFFASSKRTPDTPIKNKNSITAIKN